MESFQDNQNLEQPLLAAIWRYRWLVLLLTILCGVLALAAMLGMQTTRYEGSASLIVSDPRASTLFGADEVSRLDPDRYLLDQIAILRSDSVAQRASDLARSADADFAPNATEIAKNVKIRSTVANEILVTYTASDPTEAIRTVNSVIEAYEAIRGEEAIRESASAVAQLDQFIEEIDNEIAAIEDEMATLRSSPIRESLNDQLETALLKLTVLQPRLSLTTGERLAELRAEIADIDAQLATFAQIITIEEQAPQLAQLDRLQAQALGRRGSLAQQRDQLLVDTELLSGGISLSSPAQFAREVKANVLTVTVLGALLGFLIGATAAYLLAARRRRFAERAQPRWVLDAQLLAEIPSFVEEGVTSNLPVAEYPHSVSAESFRFAATTLDLQMTTAQLQGDGSAANTFLVTSAGPQEGKTVLTANLALAAAREGRKVLVIDADFGNQQLSALLNPDRQGGAGITEVVEAGMPLESATVAVGPAGSIDLLERGRRRSTALDFFNLPASRVFLDSVGEAYDIILIDGPPMLHVAYASILARYVDQVVVVVQHGSAVKRLEDLSQRLDLIQTPLAGYIYNAAPWRYEMMLTEGSLRDVVGDRNHAEAPAAPEFPVEDVRA